jgi:hypothetical protein
MKTSADKPSLSTTERSLDIALIILFCQAVRLSVAMGWKNSGPTVAPCAYASCAAKTSTL